MPWGVVAALDIASCPACESDCDSDTGLTARGIGWDRVIQQVLLYQGLPMEEILSCYCAGSVRQRT